LIAGRANGSEINHRRRGKMRIFDGDFGLTGGEGNGADSGIASQGGGGGRLGRRRSIGGDDKFS